ADLMTVFGHESRIAHSGADAVAAFSDEQFDLTFMDVHMPGMNGVEACSKIRQSDPHAKLVFITG
ncbi:MAG: response regulator, partial [Desulfuromonadales bacterium]|nr:response regulator [Desulfuromonadales bacterium]